MVWYGNHHTWYGVIIIITIITANIHANTKNSSLYVRYTTRASQIKGRLNKSRAKRSHWLRRR